MVAIPALSFQLLVLSWITAKRQLIHDRTASRTEWSDSYDFIIVGAGAAGCIVANRLAASGRVSVLLLEAGGAQDAIYNDIPALFQNITSKRPYLQWMPYTVPQKRAGHAFPGARILQTSGKALGGASTHNEMIFIRGNPKGYDKWETEFGAKGWNFKELLPYFKKFENNTDKDIVKMSPGLHGTSGPVQLTTPKDPGDNLLKLKKVYNSLGFMDTDINGAQQTGTMIGQSFITTKGFRASSSNSYVDPNPYPQSLHIVTKALVTKVLFKGLTAVGVEFAKNDKPFRVYAKKEVIISAGAINTPQILMLSGVGPKEHLKSHNIPVRIDLPVGDNYKNHFTINLNPPFAPPLSVQNLEELYYERSGPLSKHPYVVICFSTRSTVNNDWPNMCIWSVLGLSDKIHHILYLAKVKSAGTVRLLSTSPYIDPLIDPNFLADAEDYIAAIEGTVFMYYFSEHPLIAQNVSLPTLESVGCPTCPGKRDYQCLKGIKCYIERYSQTLHHPCCTCRMGAVHRNDVVVDSSLKVKNANNLRVCDASIMPDIPNGNLYASSLMVGEKCAQIIKEFYNL